MMLHQHAAIDLGPSSVPALGVVSVVHDPASTLASTLVDGGPSGPIIGLKTLRIFECLLPWPCKDQSLLDTMHVCMSLEVSSVVLCVCTKERSSACVRGRILCPSLSFVPSSLLKLLDTSHSQDAAIMLSHTLLLALVASGLTIAPASAAKKKPKPPVRSFLQAGDDGELG